MATATESPRLTRDQVAERLTEILTDEPQSEATLARHLGYKPRSPNGRQVDTTVVHAACAVLESRAQAKRIPNTAGTKQGGWARWDSAHEAAIIHPQEIDWPYDGGLMIPFNQMFVDQTYQRPLTSFVNQIEKRFDPVLFQTLSLSDRGTKSRPRYAIIDGQTRWVAGSRIGVQEGPSTVFKKLTPEQEADVFWRLQKHRRGVLSFHRFRAQLGSKDPQSLAIKALVESVGYVIGDSEGQLKAVGALESCWRLDDYALERALVDLRAAWPTIVPEGRHIRGLHYFLRQYPIDKMPKQEVDDEKLVTRLSVVGLDGLKRKAIAAKELGGNPDKHMALAIQSAYLSRSAS